MGHVTYDNHLNTVSHSHVTLSGSNDVSASGELVTISGALTLLLSNSTSTSTDGGFNSVFLGEDEGNGGTPNGAGYGLIVGGLTTVTGGNGQDKITLSQGNFKLGAVINTASNPGGFHDLLDINGSLFGGGVLVTMSGPKAEIDINNGDGFQTTEFKGAFLAHMLGSSPLIVIADGSGSGYSPVLFDSSVTAWGTPGFGGIFEYDPANVTFFAPLVNPVLIGFTKVLS
jgi:hypothetical protein